MRFVDAAADRGDDLVDDAQEMLLVLETHRQRLKHAVTLHVDAFVAVDQDIVDARILEQRLERTQAGHLVENFGNEIVEFLCIQRETLDQHILRNQLLHVPADFFFRHFVERGKIDLLDQPAMQAHFGVEQLVAEQRIFGLLRGSAGCSPMSRGIPSRTRLRARWTSVPRRRQLSALQHVEL